MSMHFERDQAIRRLFETGFSLHQRQQFDQAAARYRKVLELQPRHFDAVHLLGLLALQQNQPERALELIGAALNIDSDSSAAFLNYGNALSRLGRFEAAITSFSRAIALNPEFADAYFNRANAQRRLNRPEEAAADYARAIAVKPDFIEAYYNRAEVFMAMRRYKVAIASYDRVIALKPDHSEAYNNRGASLTELKRFGEAVASFDRSLELDPRNLSARVNRGNALFLLERYEEAIRCYESARRALADGRSEPAGDQDQAALAGSIRGPLMAAYQRLCDWRELPGLCSEIDVELESGRAGSHPLTVIAYTDAADVQKRAAALWVSQHHPPSDELGPIETHARHERIRVGYFSCDFREHSVGTAIAQLFEVQDRLDFEWTAFSFGPDTQDALRKRLAPGVDRFIDVRDKSDREVALLARSLEIDIGVDLGGHTMGSRPGIFALRTAPLQVSYLGYSGTVGAPYIDYLIADEVVIPAGSARHYQEKIIYLPDSYLVSDATRSIAERRFTREELGLPQQGFVYCCFNNNYKITPALFDVWMRILRRVQGSVLWLSAGNERAQSNLRREAQKRDVDPRRVHFALRVERMAEHLARYRAADLFLDTMPYNAHTTASDALWAGLPVLTRLGEAFASRVAGSLLRALRLEELITTTADEYEEMAVRLACEPQRLAGIGARLWDQRQRGVLFDTGRYARNLERAYRRIHRRSLDQLPPEHIRVDE